MSLRSLGVPALFAVSLTCAAGCSTVNSPTEVAAPEPGPGHETGAFEASDGQYLFYRAWHPTGEVRGVVVVTHGLKDHSGRYEAFASKLTARGFAVYAWDLRGHGHSGGRRVWVERFDDYVADLGRFVELASAREHTEQVFVLGHSMGGAITTLYAMAHPEHVAGVILSAAALVSNANPLEESGARVFDVIAAETGVFQLGAEDFSRDPAVVAAMKSDPLVYQPGAPAHTAVELVDALGRIDASMESLKVPVLAMHGTADVVTDPEGSKALARRAGTQDKTVKLYEGLVHDLLHEPEHAKVEADVLAWLESHAKTSP